MKKILMFVLFTSFFTTTTFAEEKSFEPYYTIEEMDFEEGKYRPFAIEGSKYGEYTDQYIASQTTETPVVLPSGETVIISTKGTFGGNDEVSLNPKYIKIKEQKAGSLKKGDCIYFEINKGTFLKDIAVTTQGDINAVASAKGAYIKLEITETSTEPSEITLSRIMILSGGINKSAASKNEFTLSLCSKYMTGDNLFYNTRSVKLNPRFASMEWKNYTICYEGYRFEGRLSFTDGVSYYTLNDNLFPMSYLPYMKENTLMVPLRSLYHALMVDNDYCERYQYNNSLYEYPSIDWDSEQQTATVKYSGYYHIVSFQNNSNIAEINEMFKGENLYKTIEMPVSPEIKNGTLYVPAKAAIEILYGKGANVYCDDDNKTVCFEI